ncbi:MAG: HAMP domain-containing protein [Actinomycetia bacterium]|nr:HAMP domain-containing protein [Actinomycetes bacterium]MCP4962065.1 HAMP domain-containing protein [Actinomycetes bacterium]
MRRSIKFRLIVLGVFVASLAVLVTGLVVGRLSAGATVDELERILDDQDRIAAEISELAFRQGSWEATTGLVDNLAEETGLRIVVRDWAGALLIDSQADVPVSQRTQLSENAARYLDPGTELLVGDFDLFGEGSEEVFLAFDVKLSELATECLGQMGVLESFEMDDETGVLMPFTSDFDAEDLCYELALAQLAEDPEFVEVLGPLVDFDETFFVEPALLYLGYDGSDQLGSAGESLSGEVVLVMAIAALVAGGAMMIVAGRVLGPISMLTRAARQMGHGDLSERVDVTGEDELGQLADAFNEMADSIEANEGRRQRMTSDVAHELRTPLANVRGYVEAAQDGVVPTDDGLLDTLHDETVHLQNIVEDIQTLSLAEAGRLNLAAVPVPLAEVADAVLASHAARAAHASVDLSSIVGDQIALADPTRLRQVLVNLIENALRYTEPEGKVRISTRNSSDGVELLVSDSGIGMGPDQIDRVFDRFYRSDEARGRESGGAGLGLAIVDRLVQSMGGTVRIESTVDVGSTFIVSLDAAP